MRIPTPRRSLLALLVLASWIAVGCSAPMTDLADWRASSAAARPPAERGRVELELAEVERLRQGGDLAGARDLALTLAAEAADLDPAAGRVLYLASRSESDAVFLFPGDAASRNAAAASALDFAQRAAAAGEDSAEAEAQRAWALGTTTHLRGMFQRSAHARETIAVAQAVLAREAEQPTAHAVLALVQLRLETLPWIAKAMAWGRPDSSLEAAETHARRAFAARPSLEYCIILAKVLEAAGRGQEAALRLEASLAESGAHPRDRALEAEARRILAD